jgi:predicted nucleotidyltransferase
MVTAAIDRDRILAALREFKRDHAWEYRILSIGLFGSFARGDAREDSDVDIVFSTDEPNLFRTARMKQALESLLARHVDVIRWRESMNPRLKERIAQETRYV